MDRSLQGFWDAERQIQDIWSGLPAWAQAGAAAAAVLMALVLIFARKNAKRRRAAAAASEARLLAAGRDSAAASEAGLAELRGRLATIAEMTSARQAELSETFNQRLDHVSDRLARNLEGVSDRLGQGLNETGARLGSHLSQSSHRTAETLAQLGERLALLDKAQAGIAELSGQVVGLRDVLANKQARGAFGQGRMEAIIEDGLPRGAYEFQATLSNGKRPDCLIRLPSAPAPLVIDAKFPLESFEALRLAATPEATAKASAQVRTAIGRHIDDIAEKYLIPGETQGMALMFVPSESVCGDIMERFPDLVQQAHRMRVMLVSPNMLMLAVQTMLAILKDVRMREQAGLIQREVGLLMGDVGKLAERVRDLERHFTLASKDVEKVLGGLEKVTQRGRRIEAVELAESPAGDATKPLTVVAAE